MPNYKSTLNIPKTPFPMRPAPDVVDGIQQKWTRLNIVQQLAARDNNNSCQKFILHDGPPFANGKLHLGHALNKILKDIFVRYYSGQGMLVQWICGWDTHGLPIELAVTKAHPELKTATPCLLRAACNRYANEQINLQIDQFQQLGLLTDLRQHWKTNSWSYEWSQLQVYQKIVSDQLIYRFYRPVHWSPAAQSVCAENEIEYQIRPVRSLFIAFPVAAASIPATISLPSGIKFLIWTTTPWTIPANQALAIGENYEYSLVAAADDYYIIANALIKHVQTQCNWTNVKIIQSISPQDLIKLKAIHPLYQKTVPVLFGHHVVLELGTGVVHIACGFGDDDFLIGQKYNLKLIAPIDDHGHFTADINDELLVGRFYLATNKIIEQRLAAANYLVGVWDTENPVAIDWRNNKPTFYRATYQWFINLNKVKPNILQNLAATTWHPTWARKNIQQMIVERKTWCFSRQRKWGVPIIAFYNKKQEPQLNSELVKFALNKLATNQNLDLWFEKPADYFLPPQYQNQGWTKEQDIMDVWFDSGVSHNFALNQNNQTQRSDLIIEGCDQFRGWFNSSLIVGTINNNHAPYKNVMVHGFVNDENGHKLSKSKGNFVDLITLIKNYGIDILRLWVATIDTSGDVRISATMMKQIQEYYRKVRNTLRFMVGNLTDFNVDRDFTTPAEVDQFMIKELMIVAKKVQAFYDEYHLHLAFKEIINFINQIFANFYLNLTKDILYIELIDNHRRRQVQSTLYIIYRKLIDLIKPILPFLTEEIHSHVHFYKKTTSIHLETNYFIPIVIATNVHTKWKRLMELRSDINQALEQARQTGVIKSTSSAYVKIFAKNPTDNEFLKTPNLDQYFGVAKLVVADHCDDWDDFKLCLLNITAASGVKCMRCWNFVSAYVAPELCDRCTKIMKQLAIAEGKNHDHC